MTYINDPPPIIRYGRDSPQGKKTICNKIYTSGWGNREGQGKSKTTVFDWLTPYPASQTPHLEEKREFRVRQLWLTLR